MGAPGVFDWGSYLKRECQVTGDGAVMREGLRNHGSCVAAAAPGTQMDSPGFRFGDKCFHLRRIHGQLTTIKMQKKENRSSVVDEVLDSDSEHTRKTLVLGGPALLLDVLHNLYRASITETHSASKAQ